MVAGVACVYGFGEIGFIVHAVCDVCLVYSYAFDIGCFRYDINVHVLDGSSG